MNTKDIIKNYESELQKKELEKQNELEKIKLRKKLNGEDIEKCIKETIKPIFEKNKIDIQECNYISNVDLIHRKHSWNGGNRDFLIGIKLIVHLNKQNKYHPSPGSYILYEGDFDSQELTKSIYIKNYNTPPSKTIPDSINKITTHKIEQEVQEFLRQVFSIK